VAQHDRQLRRRQRLRHPVPLMNVRAADRRDVDAHEQGAWLELVLAGHGELADLDRLTVFGDDGRARGLGQAHGFLLGLAARFEVYRCSRIREAIG
jgi:hypothetical protein